MNFDTHEATELYFAATCDAAIYRKFLLPAYQTLEKKWLKGIFDRKKAEDLFRKYTLRAAAKAYTKAHLERGAVWHRHFPVSVRQEVADYLVCYVLTELEIGNSWINVNT